MLKSRFNNDMMYFIRRAESHKLLPIESRFPLVVYAIDPHMKSNIAIHKMGQMVVLSHAELREALEVLEHMGV